MTNPNDEIRQANRKALPKFLLTLFCAALVGGVFGYCAAFFGLYGVFKTTTANLKQYFIFHIYTNFRLFVLSAAL